MAFRGPTFRVKFDVQMFDLDHQQGLSVEVDGKKRQAIRVEYHATPAAIATRLRALADWIDQAGGT